MSHKIIIAVVSFLVGLGIAVLFLNRADFDQSCTSNFRYLNPRLSCSTRYPIAKHEYLEFKNNLVSYIEAQKEQDLAISVSVYFRDLFNGPTFGIDEEKDFIPASLLKIPVLITYLKLSESDSTLLQKELVYKQIKKEEELEQFFIPQDMVKEGKAYKIDDLILRMISNSDNSAYDVLFAYLSEKFSNNTLLETYRELGIIYPQHTLENTITVKSYASIFRLLYQASYISPELSEKALEMLAKSNFKDGLAAGIPKNIAIAHKFGERQDSSNEQKQLHDCGIVYYPNNPYLLCIMTRGKDFQSLLDIIQMISKKVYQEVESRKNIQ